MSDIKLGINTDRRQRIKQPSFREWYREIRKQKFNLLQWIGLFIFWVYTSTRDYELSDKELNSLIKEIESILKSKVSNDFIINIDALIISARREINNSNKILSRKDKLRHISKIRNNSINLLNSLNFEGEYRYLRYDVDRSDGYISLDSESLLNKTQSNIKEIIDNCNKLEDKIKQEKPKKIKMTTIRQNVAENLAMYFDLEGIKVTKYEEGYYIKVLSIILENIYYREGDKVLNMYVPDNIYEIASNAINNYKHSREHFAIHLGVDDDIETLFE